MSYDDCECCVFCGDPIAFELFIEQPNGDRVHRHCEEDYEHAEMVAWHERHRPAGYVAEGA